MSEEVYGRAKYNSTFKRVLKTVGHNICETTDALAQYRLIEGEELNDFSVFGCSDDPDKTKLAETVIAINKKYLFTEIVERETSFLRDTHSRIRSHKETPDCFDNRLSSLVSIYLIKIYRLDSSINCQFVLLMIQTAKRSSDTRFFLPFKLRAD